MSIRQALPSIQPSNNHTYRAILDALEFACFKDQFNEEAIKLCEAGDISIKQLFYSRQTLKPHVYYSKRAKGYQAVFYFERLRLAVGSTGGAKTPQEAYQECMSFVNKTLHDNDMYWRENLITGKREVDTFPTSITQHKGAWKDNLKCSTIHYWNCCEPTVWRFRLPDSVV